MDTYIQGDTPLPSIRSSAVTIVSEADVTEIARAVVHEHFGKHEEFDELIADIATAFSTKYADAVAAERERCANEAKTAADAAKHMLARNELRSDQYHEGFKQAAEAIERSIRRVPPHKE